MALRPRDYSYRLPRKALQLATRMAMASKLRDGQLVVIDDLVFGNPATKEMAGILGALGLGGNSTLIATADHNVNVYMSARNIERVQVLPVSGLNALAILSPRRVLITRAALEALRRPAPQAV